MPKLWQYKAVWDDVRPKAPNPSMPCEFDVYGWTDFCQTSGIFDSKKCTKISFRWWRRMYHIFFSEWHEYNAYQISYLVFVPLENHYSKWWFDFESGPTFKWAGFANIFASMKGLFVLHNPYVKPCNSGASRHSSKHEELLGSSENAEQSASSNSPYVFLLDCSSSTEHGCWSAKPLPVRAGD